MQRTKGKAVYQFCPLHFAPCFMLFANFILPYAYLKLFLPI